MKSWEYSLQQGGVKASTGIFERFKRVQVRKLSKLLTLYKLKNNNNLAYAA